MGKGRPNKYYTHVLPRFEEIKEWLQAGATDKEIAENLGVNPKVFCKYKSEFNDLNELCKNGRLKAVQEIKAAMFKRATGFQYVEKTITKSEKNGLTETTYMKYALPDPTSALILLKHWDQNTEWTSDPASLRLRKKELELKEKQADSWS